ncbi:hypothetical protein ACCO45_005418 [Purpureocillium lilacinum]|uniref:Uncharacterized protein n=1 Tax=Purpureocillium lilacinum TaxID=33203 RepID=A0ACC4DVD3_PURLI
MGGRRNCSVGPSVMGVQFSCASGSGLRPDAAGHGTGQALRATGVCVGGGTGGSGSATACRPCQLIYLLDATPSIAPRPQLLHHPLRWEPARHPSGEVAPPRPLNEMARKGGFVFAIVADPPRGGTLIQRASIGE